MRVVNITEPGGPDSLELSHRAEPIGGPHDVVIRVAAAGINRADIHQREGNYPPPAGAPPWPGLEVSGTVISVGTGVVRWKEGDRVCALLAGGGYAEEVAVNSGLVLPVPDSVALDDAAALPEAITTVWSTIVMSARLKRGETLLVHGGSGGIGTMAIQVATALGCRVAVTSGSAEKLDVCRDLGADILINYHSQDFVDRILSETDGRGADVILDAVGGAYLDRNLRSLADHGRVELIGNQSGAPGELSVGRLMAKWGTIHASTLRARTLTEKQTIIASVLGEIWPRVQSGEIKPVVHEKFAFADAARAHEMMESGSHIGKLLLVP